MSVDPSTGVALQRLVAELERGIAPLDLRRWTLCVAGERIAVHAGVGAVALLESMEALRTADLATSSLQLFVIDGRSDGIALPDTVVTRRHGFPPGGLGAFSAEGIHAFYQPHAGVLSVLDAPKRRAWCWVRDVTALPYYEFAAPLRHLLQWWIVGRGGALVHSAAVGTSEGGALIVGPSGSGKSTTALACLEAGLSFAGDDYVLIAPGEPPTVHMAYATAKIVRDALPRHAHYADYFRNLGNVDEKPMLFMHEAAPAALLRSFPLRALVLPVVARVAKTRIVPAAPADVLRALAPSSVMLFPLAGSLAFRRIAAWCRTLPCFRAELGDDPRDVGTAFATWLSRDFERVRP